MIGLTCFSEIFLGIHCAHCNSGLTGRRSSNMCWRYRICVSCRIKWVGDVQRLPRWAGPSCLVCVNRQVGALGQAEPTKKAIYVDRSETRCAQVCALGSEGWGSCYDARLLRRRAGAGVALAQRGRDHAGVVSSVEADDFRTDPGSQPTPRITARPDSGNFHTPLFSFAVCRDIRSRADRFANRTGRSYVNGLSSDLTAPSPRRPEVSSLPQPNRSSGLNGRRWMHGVSYSSSGVSGCLTMPLTHAFRAAVVVD